MSEGNFIQVLKTELGEAFRYVATTSELVGVFDRINNAHQNELSNLTAENAELKKDLAGVCEYMLEITDMNNPDFGSKTVLQFAAGMGLLYTKARQVQEKWGEGRYEFRNMHLWKRTINRSRQPCMDS